MHPANEKLLDALIELVAESGEPPLEAAERMVKDAKRYRWLRDYGHSHFIYGSASSTPGRGPYIRLSPPAMNQFSDLTLWGDVADTSIDAAMRPLIENIEAKP